MRRQSDAAGDRTLSGGCNFPVRDPDHNRNQREYREDRGKSQSVLSHHRTILLGLRNLLAYGPELGVTGFSPSCLAMSFALDGKG